MTLFYEEFIFLDKSFKNQQAFFEAISEELFSKGWVKASFKEALVKREQAFPTGLETQPISVAIPHTDAEYVKKNFIAMIRVNEPISFVHMGIPNKKVAARIMFLLGIVDPANQVKILSNLVTLLSNEKIMTDLMHEKSRKKIVQTMNKEICL